MNKSLQFFVGLLCLFVPQVLQAQFWPNPEVLYYKMNGAGTTVPNDALSPPAGTATATIQGGVTQGGTGKCGGGLIGSGIASTTDFLNTGWATNITSTASWTISFYAANFGSTSSLYYIFGDAGASSFRCFTNGVAGANNWILRGTGITDITVAGGATVAPHHIAFVYDASLANIKGYLDGVLVSTVAQGAFSMVSAGPFKVMGYSANIGAPAGGILDEFRLYNRALNGLEIAGIHGVLAVNATSTPSPATICAGDQLTLTGTGNGSSYSWSDGVNSYPDNTAFVPTTAGTYVVTGTDGAGCTATSSLTVTINALPVVTASANPGTNICGIVPVTLQGGGANTYAWNGIPTLGSDTVLNPPTSGTYTVVGVDANNCSASSNITLTVWPGISVTASASSSPICMGSTSTLSAIGATTYTWMPGSLNGSPVVMPLTNTTYTVTGTDGSGCTAASTVDVIVNPAGLSTPTVVEDSTCAPGGVVNLSASGTLVKWYDAVSGGTLLNTGNNYSPNISNTETYYVDNADQTIVGPFAVSMPPQTSTFSSNARGYVFTAPNDFVITSLFVPTTASSGNQDIAVVKFNGNIPPPFFSATTNAFTVEFLTQNNSTVGSIPVNIPVLAGEVIGILGTRNAVNSYSNAGNVITINGSSVALTRLGMQFPLNTTAPQDLWQEAGGSISRIEFEYSNITTGCPSYPRVPVVGTVNPLPNVTANITPSTTCANTSAIPTGAGAQSYTWDAGLVDGQTFIVSTGNTTYTVTGIDANGCSATSTALVSASASSGSLAAATSSQLQNQGDDMSLSYYDASCNLIASVDDGALGNILGLTSAAVNVDATAGSHNGQPFVRRWYEITPASNGSADVVLYVNQSDFDDYNAIVLPPYLPMPTSGSNADPNIPNIRITKNDNTGLGNNPVVITPGVNWNGQYWELSFNTSSFSQFRIHSANQFNAPLPVSLLKFEGQKRNTSDLLTWVTSAEQNNAYFNLQYSRDAKSFETIAQVNSKAVAGNSHINLAYAYEHLKPQAGHNYYRLEQVDLNGQHSVQSKVLDLIRTGAGSIVQLYPNPVQQTLNIEWYAEKSVVSAVKVFDMSGRMVQQIQANLQSGINTLTMDFSTMASGIYTVQLFEDDHLSFVEQVRKTQ